MKSWRQDPAVGTRFMRLSRPAQEDEPGPARVLGADDPSQHGTESACLAAGHVLRATGA